MTTIYKGYIIRQLGWCFTVKFKVLDDTLMFRTVKDAMEYIDKGLIN